MNTLFSIDYYKKHEKDFEGKRGVITPEEDLENAMAAFENSNFSEEDFNKIRLVMAKRVHERLRAELLENKIIYNRVREDSGCLGYTTKIQEVQEAGRIIRTFEFNCYKLSKFREKYSL